MRGMGGLCRDGHIYTVSPVEKLTNRTTGTLLVRSRYGHGTVAVRSRFGRGAVEVRSRYGRGTVEVRSQCVIRCSVVAVRSRYSLGTLPVRSWYSILEVHSTLYSRRASNLVHVLFVLLFELRNRGLAGFGSAIDTIPLIRNVFAA